MNMGKKYIERDEVGVLETESGFRYYRIPPQILFKVLKTAFQNVNKKRAENNE